jgi:hypothetical protein
MCMLIIILKVKEAACETKGILQCRYAYRVCSFHHRGVRLFLDRLPAKSLGELTGRYNSFAHSGEDFQLKCSRQFIDRVVFAKIDDQRRLFMADLF